MIDEARLSFFAEPYADQIGGEHSIGGTVAD
jgi:hypothetical protein